MGRWVVSRRSVISPRLIGIAAGVVALVLLVYYFASVGVFTRLLSREQTAALAEQEKRIGELEAQIEKAEREKTALLKRAQAADRRADVALEAASLERRKAQAWAAKYAEIKARPRDKLDTPEKAMRALREMGWAR